MTRHYDPMGRETFVSQPALSNQSTAGMASSYDALGRLLSQQETVAPYAQTTHSYLSQHRYRVTDPAGHFTDYLSDGYGGPQGQDYRAIEHSSGVITSLLKNAWGELIELRQQGNHNGFVVDQRHYYDYDAVGRVCRHAVPETGVSFYQYDAAGQLTAYANGQSGTGCAVPFNNDRIELSYDALGRQLQVDFTNPASAAISYSYDADGQLLSSSRDGMLWSYDYNALGLLTSEQLTVDGRSYALSYQYNSNAHLQQQTYPSGLVLDYQRDGLGRLLQVQQQGSNLLSAISYHPSGQVTSMLYGNGVSYQQQLNAQLLPATISASHANGVALSQSMSYDSRGNLLSLTDHALPSNSRSNSYDGLNRLISASGPWGTGGFVYDALGNLRSKTLGNRTVSLSYNSLNQLSQSNDSGHSGLRQFSYDSRGNVISAGNLQFSYDATDQPISISGVVSGSYHYDGQFKRVKQQVNGSTIYSVYNQAGQLVHIDNLGSQQQTDYLSGPQGNFARISNGIISYLHPDILGSAQSATDASGNLLWQQQYSPFGEELQTVSANHHQAGFTGHISDTDTGLHYMQARYYDPVIGRFYSNDPVGFSVNNPMMFNRYAYANNNPYKFVDPDGRQSELKFEMPSVSDKLSNMFGFDNAADGNSKIETRINEISDSVSPYPESGTLEVNLTLSGALGASFTASAGLALDSHKNSALSFTLGGGGGTPNISIEGVTIRTNAESVMDLRGFSGTTTVGVGMVSASAIAGNGYTGYAVGVGPKAPLNASGNISNTWLLPLKIDE